jgi:hypothetical protein
MSLAITPVVIRGGMFNAFLFEAFKKAVEDRRYWTQERRRRGSGQVLVLGATGGIGEGLVGSFVQGGASSPPGEARTG